MIIHVVKPGDTLYLIGRQYGVDPNKIISDNELSDPNQLVVGQTLVILEGERTHTVARGQSLYTIARIYGVTVDAILTANPQITDPTRIYPGQTITIPSTTEKLGTMEVNGYALPGMDMEVLRKTLPYLTYLSIFSYPVNEDGTLTPINDDQLIQAARNAGVAPLMVITNTVEGEGFSSDLVATILRNEDIQDTLINNIIQILDSKNYFGLDIDFEYIYPQDKENYNNFLRKVTERLEPLGYKVSTALAPKISADQRGRLYEAHDYPVHGELADKVVLMTYEWGYIAGPARAVAPINEVRKVLNYAVTAIPPQKILMGVPNYGYDWTLPFRPGTTADLLTNPGAVDLARNVNAAIEYDPTAQAPYYNYYDQQGREHEVWFEDARSIEAKMKLVNEYNLGGVSYWTIGSYFPQNWLVLSSYYDIEKVI